MGLHCPTGGTPDKSTVSGCCKIETNLCTEWLRRKLEVKLVAHVMSNSVADALLYMLINTFI